MARPWFAFYPADYLAKTTSLTTELHGAYMLLLMAYWANGGPLADDQDELAAICKMTPATFQRARNRLCKFFTIADGVWANKRMDEELTKTQGMIAQKSAAGKASAQRKSNRSTNGDPNGNSTRVDQPLERETQREVNQSQLQPQEKIPVASQLSADAPPAEPDLAIPGFLDRRQPADLKTELFGPCLAWLASQSGKPEGQLRPLIGKWLRDWGDGAVLEAFVAAQRESPVEPVGWITRALEARSGTGTGKRRRPTAGETARAGIAAALLADA